MANIIRGKLVVIATKNKKDNGLRVSFPTKKGGMSNPTLIQARQLHPDLAKRPVSKLNGQDVDLELEGGLPMRIRPVDTKWVAPVVNQDTTSKPSGREAARTVRPQEQSRHHHQSNSNNSPGEFHNPYNFIPALPRDHLPKADLNNPKRELNDAPPAGHACYLKDYWSGRISVKLTTVTPLLIPDAAEMTETNGHKTYPIRRGVDDKPYLPPTSIKGMLRSAYEAVTNSRLSVFQGHGDRLAYRMPAKVGPIPARVERQGDALVLRIMKEPHLLSHAGKLPRYQNPGLPPDKGESTLAIKYEESSQLPQHEDPVWVELKDGVVNRIRFWTPEPPGDSNWQKGWVCITGANISGKRYERVFIEGQDNPIIPINPEMQALWRELIINYQETHKKEIEKRRKNGQQPQAYLGNDPGKTGWSRHVYDNWQRELHEGTLCYVEFTNGQVSALIPVSISRRLYPSAPDRLLDYSLKPALDIEGLSPVDRVFGWVRQEEGDGSKGSYKGSLRVHSVQCPDLPICQIVDKFGDEGFPLNILGQPKPQQAKFYVARDRTGQPLLQNTEKKDSYRQEQFLRGRKVYPHHANLPPQYWDDPLDDRTQTNQSGYFQEYRRPKLLEEPDPKKPKRKDAQPQYRERDEQNRSIKAWVKPNITFSFDIDVINLSSVELGALLWLLSLPPEHYHRLGGGKPFGFGSIRLDINWESTDLRKGEDWQQYYKSLLQSSLNPKPRGAEATIQQFREAFEQAYGDGENFDDIPLIQAFCRCAKGFEDGLPIHYPRARKQGQTGAVPPHPEGKAFEWFVANEKKGNQYPLPPLWNETGLPFFRANKV